MEKDITVKHLAREAWGDMAASPGTWLLLSASAVPFVFLLHFLMGGAATGLSLFLLLVGYAVCFCPHFLAWCAAVRSYASRHQATGRLPADQASRGTLSPSSLPCVLTGLTWGALALVVHMAAQMATVMLLGLLLSGAGEASQAVVSAVQYFYLAYVAADLVLVLVVLAPQALGLSGSRTVEEAIRTSYRWTRERYGLGVKLFLVAELAVRTLMLVGFLLIPLLRVPGLVVGSYLVFLSLLEGTRTAFLAASFTRLYYHIMEEERRRKGKKRVGRRGGK